MSDRIAIVFYRYDSICEEDYIDAFKALGIEVFEITEEMKDKDIPQSKRVELVHNAIESVHPAFIFSVNFFPAVADICFIHKVLYLCQTVDSPMPTLFSASIRHSTNRIFLFDRAQFERFSCYNPECVFYLPLSSAVKRYDGVIEGITEEDVKRFSEDISFVGSLYSEKNPLNGAFNTAKCKPDISAAKPSFNRAFYFEECKTDVTKEKNSFNRGVKLSDYSRGFIDGLLDMQERVYGSNLIEGALNDRCISELKKLFPDYFAFDNAVDDTDRYIAAHSVLGMELAERERVKTLNTLAAHFDTTLYTRSETGKLKGVVTKGGVLTHTEMPKIFNLSKINLNITIRPIETGLPLRIFDIMGCHGFVLSNYQDEIAGLFNIGEDIEVYSDYEELVAKCSYYLEHEDERKRIAENGYRRVAENYTYEKRVMEMFKVILGDSE